MNKMNCHSVPLLKMQPQAAAIVRGSVDYPDIYGTVRFYTAKNGVLIYADVNGLPQNEEPCNQQIFGFHIHGGSSCTGNEIDYFSDAGTHLDLNNCGHPSHTGDLPPLFGNNGKAVLIFLTNRFSVKDIMGKAIIIHGDPDDFTTQPGGNAGEKIACGIIRPVMRK